MNYLFLIVTLAVIAVVLFIAAFTKFELSDEGYDRLKSVVQKWDYMVVFLAVIIKTFSISYGFETVTIVAGLGAMLAGLLGIANTNYKGQKITQALNQDLLKDMLGFDEDLHLMGELETEDIEDIEEIEESGESEEK